MSDELRPVFTHHSSLITHHCFYTASDRLVNEKSRALMAGAKTGKPAPKRSEPVMRMLGDMASMLLSILTGVSLKRKFLMAYLSRPCSIRNVPSRVKPVNRTVCGSTKRMYQKRVTRMPRSVLLIISSIEVLPPSIIRFEGKAVGSLLIFLAQK